MIEIDRIDWPAELDALEIELEAECVQIAVLSAKPASTINPEIDLHSTDLNALYAWRDLIEVRRAEAEAAMNMAGDNADAWDRAAELHDQCSDELGEIKARIFELEEGGASAEPTGFRAMYFVNKL